MDVITGYIGDSSSWAIALTHPVTGAAFTPGGSYGLVATFKNRESDPDSIAVIQKATGAGIAVSGSTATVTLVRADTEGFCESNLHFGIRATHSTTGESLTVAEKRVKLEKPTTLETTTSVDVVTTETPLPFGGVTSYVDEIETLSDYPASFPPASHTHVSADVTDASEGGNGAADAGKLVKFTEDGSVIVTSVSAQSDDSIAIGATSGTSTAVYGQSGSGAGVFGVSTTLTGVGAISASGTGLTAQSSSGTYHARFGESGNDRSAIERVRGWFVWFYSTFTGRLKTADITANRDWTLPNATGTIALLEGAQTFTGQVELSGQAATSATSAMTRGLGDARYGNMIVMKVPNDKDITAASLTDIPDTEIALEANSDYEISGFFGVQTTGGSPTNRVQFRMAYTGTLQTNQGFIGAPNSSGAIFAMVNGAILTTAICDTSNIDRSYPITGSIRTSTAGNLKIQGYRITGGGTTPKLLGGSLLILRKL